MNRFDPLVSDAALAERTSRQEQYEKMIADMTAGKRLPNIPWGDPQFQGMVQVRLARAGDSFRVVGEFESFKKHLRDIVGPK